VPCSRSLGPTNQPQTLPNNAVVGMLLHSLGGNNGDFACWQFLYGCLQAELPLAVQDNDKNNDSSNSSCNNDNNDDNNDSAWSILVAAALSRFGPLRYPGWFWWLWL